MQTDTRTWPANWAPKPNISLYTARLFAHCPRKWLYTRKDRALQLPSSVPLETRQRLRLESYLMPHYMLVGQVVDMTINRVLEEYKALGQGRMDVVLEGEKVLDAYIAVSKGWSEEYRTHPTVAPDDPGIQPIDTAFFGGWTDEEEKMARERVRACLENFLTDHVLDAFMHYDPADWRLPTMPIPWFYNMDMPVYASWDFAICTPEECVILDWKTGNPDRFDARESAKDQLHCYAGFAHAHWGYSYEQITVGAVWLSGGSVEYYPMDRPRLRRVGDHLTTQYEALRVAYRQALSDPKNILTHFPMATDSAACADCVFRDCDGHPSAVAAMPPVSGQRAQ